MPANSPVNRYHRTLASARTVALALALDQQRQLLDILEEYARDIEAVIAAGLDERNAPAILAEISLLIDGLVDEMAGSVGDAVRLTARRVAEIQAMATAELIAATAGAPIVSATFSGTGARAAQAILARPELTEAFVTIRANATRAANRVILRGVTRGAPSRAIARELRQSIKMPGSLLEGDGALLSDLRRIGYKQVAELGYDPTPENLALVRGEASEIAYRASRIARTEVAQAEAETHRLGAEESPVVAFIRWRLSYRHPKIQCACEVFASEDLYGHGAGIFDPRNLPPRPHPHCFCNHIDILRPPSEWGQPRGELPELKEAPEDIAERLGFSPSLTRQLVSALAPVTPEPEPAIA